MEKEKERVKQVVVGKGQWVPSAEHACTGHNVQLIKSRKLAA